MTTYMELATLEAWTISVNGLAGSAVSGGSMSPLGLTLPIAAADTLIVVAFCVLLRNSRGRLQR